MASDLRWAKKGVLTRKTRQKAGDNSLVFSCHINTKIFEETDFIYRIS